MLTVGKQGLLWKLVWPKCWIADCQAVNSGPLDQQQQMHRYQRYCAMCEKQSDCCPKVPKRQIAGDCCNWVIYGSGAHFIAKALQWHIYSHYLR